ncbi:MAG TPA: hypothetical protein VFV33_18200, partial [Gemmatimonadaceae bacterium]|nr:hypothetical protein [Gemmatimonadaceae bacterium]
PAPEPERRSYFAPTRDTPQPAPGDQRTAVVARDTFVAQSPVNVPTITPSAPTSRQLPAQPLGDTGARRDTFPLADPFRVPPPSAES